MVITGLFIWLNLMFPKFRQVFMASWIDQAFGHYPNETERTSTGARPGLGHCQTWPASLLLCFMHLKTTCLTYIGIMVSSESKDQFWKRLWELAADVHSVLLRKGKGVAAHGHRVSGLEDAHETGFAMLLVEKLKPQLFSHILCWVSELTLFGFHLERFITTFGQNI